MVLNQQQLSGDLTWAREAYTALSGPSDLQSAEWPRTIEPSKQHLVADSFYSSIPSAYRPESVAATVKNGQITPPDDLSPSDSTETPFYSNPSFSRQVKQTQCSFTHKPHYSDSPNLMSPAHDSAQSPVQAQRHDQIRQFQPDQFLQPSEFQILQQPKDSPRGFDTFFGGHWPNETPKLSESPEQDPFIFDNSNQLPEQPEKKPRPRRQTKRAVPEPSPKPTPESPQTKRRRGRPKSQPPVMDQSALNASRETHLEKNRVAAHKCRQRKKEFIEKLETTSKEATTRNKQLKTAVENLKEELLRLKNELLEHANCGDANIDRYLKQSASNIINMDQRGTTGATAAEESQDWLGDGNFSMCSNDDNREMSTFDHDVFFDMKQ